MTKRFVREADEPRKNQSTADKLVADFAKTDRQLDAREANRKKRQKTSPIPFPVLRLQDIEKVMSDLYGSVLPEGADGAMVDLEILISTVIAAGKSPMSFMRKWVSPWMSQDDAERFVGGVNLDLAYLNADELATLMGVNFVTKDRLKTRTIGAYDVPKAERAEIYRQRAKEKRKQDAAVKKPILMTSVTPSLLSCGPWNSLRADRRRAAISSRLSFLVGTLNRCACRTNLGLPDSSRRFDIDDDRRLQADQIVVGVGKEGTPAQSDDGEPYWQRPGPRNGAIRRLC